MRILIAEPEQQLAQTLQQILAGAQYESDCVSDSEEALREALRHPYDLIILAAKLSTPIDFSVAKELRRLHVQTPILILSELATVSYKVQGLDAGADDYMTKPFDADELLARIRALTRRGVPPLQTDLQFGDLTFRPGNASAACSGRELRLNYKETEILKLLMSMPQQILSKEELIYKVWGYASTTSENNVEAYISFLRKKLHQLESRVAIVAIKKQGYKLEYPAK